ncbi:unnamed protein product [Chondrus crispus]|uniref:Uncharacterized protein n=1 Tax=Chondrus crispus TaxID=2769 RepID=R7QDQ2_CHOCR|nr:unnamed protein product [Chondrus crispus]CDF35898.1 unnamed protein product [Chondrus crispus]|eukprot:XP_005715717.1 unnamed protein product [Chondrus crispus]
MLLRTAYGLRTCQTRQSRFLRDPPSHAIEHCSHILACTFEGTRHNSGFEKDKSDSQAPDHIAEARNRRSARQWTPYTSSCVTVRHCRAHCTQNQGNCSSIAPRSKREAQITPNEDSSVRNGPPCRTEPPRISQLCQGVVEASVNDAMDVLETVHVVQNPPEMQSSDKDESAEDTIERRTIPYVVEIAELFGEQEVWRLSAKLQTLYRIYGRQGACFSPRNTTENQHGAGRSKLQYRVHADRRSNVTF